MCLTTTFMAKTNMVSFVNSPLASQSPAGTATALLDLSFTSRYNGDRVFAPFPAQAISLLEKIKIEVGKSGKK